MTLFFGFFRSPSPAPCVNEIRCPFLSLSEWKDDQMRTDFIITKCFNFIPFQNKIGELFLWIPNLLTLPGKWFFTWFILKGLPWSSKSLRFFMFLVFQSDEDSRKMSSSRPNGSRSLASRVSWKWIWPIKSHKKNSNCSQKDVAFY